MENVIFTAEASIIMEMVFMLEKAEALMVEKEHFLCRAVKSVIIKELAYTIAELRR